MNDRATAPVESAVTQIPVGNIKPSDTHVQQLRRKRYSAESLRELAASIGRVGVQSPLVVRPSAKDSGRFEICFGERRFLAAQMAFLEAVPCIVRELNDAEVLEIQLIENLQREDLHPLEEAAGFGELMQVTGMKKEELGERVGKKRSWVYSRLALLKLDGEAREALESGKLDVSRALVVAAIAQPNQQAKALQFALELDYDNRPAYSVRELRAKIAEDGLTLPLTGAPFNPQDANLVPEAGTCGGCPFRSANCDPGAENPDVCTNVVCFHDKARVAAASRAQALKAAGAKVLTGDEAQKVFHGKKLVGYVDLDEVCEDDRFPDPVPRPAKGDAEGAYEARHDAWCERSEAWKERTYRQILGDAAYDSVLLEQKGKPTRELLEVKAARRLLAERDVRLSSYVAQKPAPAAPRHDWKAEEAKRQVEQKKRQEEAERRCALRARVFTALIPKAGGALDAAELRDIAADYLQNYGTREGLAAGFGKPVKLDAVKDADLPRLIRLAQVATDVQDGHGDGRNLAALAKRLKVDVAKITKEFEAEQKAAPAKSKSK